MQDQFHQFVANYQLQEKSLLIAVSGGVDSMVLANLCRLNKLKFVVAHCNFQLRNKESDLDEVLVSDWCKQYKIPCFVQKMKTKAYALQHKTSTQVAARELRYNWFEELREQEKLDYILTAHHGDDDAETFLINFIRGTGLKGLTGIPQKNDKVLRPLLKVPKNEIIDWAKAHQVDWREDASNASLNYLRNRVRNQIIPLIKKENPNFLASFQQTHQHLNEAQNLIEDYIHTVANQVVKKEAGTVFINLKKLQEFPNQTAILYQLLNQYQFTAWQDIAHLINAANGKKVSAPNYWLMKDGDFLVLTEKNHISKEIDEIQIHNSNELVNFDNFILKLSEYKGKIKKEKQYAYFLKADLAFPLQLRKWKQTDFFVPFGMNGKKKVSDFLNDEKVPKHLKSEVWVLLNKNEIIWVVGYRTSQNYKIKTEDQKCIQFKLSSSNSY